MKKDPILLVEDDADIQENLRMFLELEGFTVQSAANGQEALDYLRSLQPVSVILLDIMMPVMNGFEFLEVFSKDPNFNKIPVIVLSAAPDLGRKALVQGFRFIGKPMDLNRLLNEIESSLQKD